MKTVVVTAVCPDRTGLVSALTGRLFDLGCDLGDTSFAALSGRAEFSSVCDLPESVDEAYLKNDLSRLPELADATIEVVPFQPAADAPPDAVSHRVVVSGGDRPGLLARLSEVFVQFQANIVRMDAHRLPGPNGGRYVTHFDVAIPERSADACLATVANTAGELGLTCHWERV